MPETEPQQTDPSQTKPRADGRPRSLDRPRRSWQEIETRLLRVTRELSSRSWPKIARGLNSLSPGHAVHLLESSPPYQRNILWSLLDDELEAEVTPLLSAEVRRQLLSKMGADELHQLANRMDIAELVATINELPDAIAKNVLNQVNLDRKQRIERLLVWPAGTAGSMISPEIPSLPYNSYVYLAQQYIQEHHEEFAGLQEIPVIDARQHYKGTISLVDLIAGGRIAPIKSLVREEIAPVYPESSTEEVITLLEDVQWDLLPVIDREGVFLGAIDRERAVESALKAADKLARSAARLDEDTFASVSKASRERTLWLLTNLMTAVLAALVIGLFQDTLERAVALAVLMPIVTSMGGVAATQTLGITVRGFALRQLHAANIRWLVNRELAVNMFSGLLLAVPSVLIVLYWFEEWLLAGILAVSVISNVVLGAIAGVLIPVIVRRLGIDAAVSGAVIVTTVTDVCGFAIFLSLGSLFYLG